MERKAIGVALAAGCAASVVALAPAARAQTWIRQLGTVADDGVVSAVLGIADEFYVGGNTYGDFAASNAGQSDVWLALFDADGTELWKRQVGTTTDDKLVSIATDAAGNALLVGTTDGSLGGSVIGGTDIWVGSFDRQGQLLWLRQFGSTEYDGAGGVALDGQGGYYVAGTTTGNLGGPNGGNQDAFVARFDGTGNQLWIVQFGTASNDGCAGAATDCAGGVFIGGWTWGSLAAPNAGFNDAWMARFDASGSPSWMHQWGTDQRDTVRALVSDGAGGAWMYWDQRFDFSHFTIWRVLSHMDAAGQGLSGGGLISWDYWNDLIGFLSSDGQSGAYVGGSTRKNRHGSVVGGWDAWIERYGGSTTWSTQLGTLANEVASGAITNGAGRTYAIGSTAGPLGGAPMGANDVWIARFDSSAVAPYCTSGTTSNGCNASIGATGTPSVSAPSGFTIDATQVEGQRSGLIYYGLNMKMEDAWGPSSSLSSSFLCIRGPWQRTMVQFSGGTDGLCDGSFQLDWNTYRATAPGALGQPFNVGQYVYAQAWFRDPAAPEGANLSDALAFVLQP
jgi:hypothetical protein